MSFTRSAQSDKTYYDITISNLTSTDAAPPVLYFNETRNNPFVLDPESYYLSIVRFTLDTNTLPVITPEIQPNQSDRDLSVYSITLEWTDPSTNTVHVNQEYLRYVPQNKQATPPAPPSQTDTLLQNNATGYYDIFNYQYWISLINVTFKTCFTNLAAKVALAGATLPTTYAPEMAWDTQQNIAILSADQAGYDDLSADFIKIYFNQSLFNLFSSFPFIIESTDVTANGKNARIIMTGFGGANLVSYPPVTATYTALQIVQEYSTLALWTPVTSIVFTSNTLPIVANQVSAPLLFFNGKRFQSGGNNANIAQVITDFVVEGGIYKPSITYVPSAQYRLVNLVGNTPLYNLDIQVFYRNRVGELIPFRLNTGGTATVKILFTRRGTEGDGKAY